jgi:serine/threonine protein kinase
LKTIMTNDIGSPCWIAPEMLNQAHYNEKCDVYSYSVIAWEVIVRLQPYFHLKDEVNSFKLMFGVQKGSYRPKNISKCPKIIKLSY